MSCHPRVTEWTATIQTHLPHLTKPQATVLALWTLGMVLARSCALTAVRVFLAAWLSRKEQTVRQQLREFCYEATAKRGRPRCALDVAPCFVPLLAWVVSLWQGTQLAVALDATTLGTRFTVLAISVVYRGCAIPVIWTVLPATAPHAWRREWLRMLRQVRRAVSRSWTVIVLADRGLYARWLFHGSPAWDGTRFCASTRAGRFVLRARCVASLSRRWSPSPAPPGRGRASPSKAAIASSTARCWRAGRQATKIHG